LILLGLNKAGQLGHGSGSSMVASPTVVKTLSNDGYRVAKVSCGFHHTLIIAVPVHAIRVFTTSLFSCGWGEHGRLGLGNVNYYY
jgi:alpha-tubulin suppressor-like RCC1 family protein